MKTKLFTLTAISLCVSSCGTTPEIPIKEDHTDTYHALYANPVTGALTLSDTIAYMLKRNADRHVKLLEQSLAQAETFEGNYSLLPKLSARTHYISRSDLQLTTSERLTEDGEETDLGDIDTVPSFSSEKDTTTTDIGLSWDILNVFNQYYTNKQLRDESLISQLNTIRSTQNAVRDIMATYYLAWADSLLHDDLVSEAKAIDQAAKERCVEAWNNIASYTDELLNDCDAMLETGKSFQATATKLKDGKTKLAALITTSPESDFSITGVQYLDPGELKTQPELMIEVAMRQRPELLVEEYKKRIARNDQKKAWLGLFPKLEIGIRANTTDNPFVVNDDWTETYVNFDWAIIDNLLTAPLRAKVAKYREKLAGARQEALIVTIVSQVYLAAERYKSARANWLSSYRLEESKRHLVNRAVAGYNAKTISNVQYRSSRSDHLRARFSTIIHYAEMQDALAQLILSLGYNLVPYDLKYDLPHAELVATIQEALRNVHLTVNTSIGVSS